MMEMDRAAFKRALEFSARAISDSLPRKEKCEDITFSPRFEKRMERMIRDHEKFYYFWFNTIAKRVAMVALLVVLGLAVTTFSVKAWRESLIDFVVEFFETFAIVRVEHEEVQVPATIPPVEPTYIPEGFIGKEISKDELVFSKTYYDYSGKQRGEFSYRQSVIIDGGIHIDMEDVDYRTITINGYEGVVRFKLGSTAILFATEKCVFSVSGTIDETELIRIAESIPLG